MTDTDPQRVSPAFTTGGGGFSFEDRASAWVLAGMLAGQAPVGAGLGVPRAVEFQQKVPPAPLDDLVIRGDGSSWWSSIKSFDLLKTALGDFVVAAWEHALTPQFDFGRDYLGFICGQSSGDDWTSLLELIETIRNDTPERIAERIAIPGSFNATDRQLWEAFKCPQGFATEHGLNRNVSPATLLSRLVPLQLDFRSADSSAEAQARSWCEAALATGHAARANDLYNAVLQLVARTRPSGGSITWARAQRELGAEFALARRADAAPDWAVLEQHTAERVNAVRDVLVDDLRLPRASAHAQLAGVAAAPFIFLTGPSGCGKSALAKAWLRSAPSQLWLSPRDLGDGLLGFSNRLGLRFALADVLELGQAPVRVVVDGLDRSYDPAAHVAAAALASAAAESGGALELVVTSQSFAVGRVSQLMAQGNAPTPSTVVMDDFDDEDIRLVLEQRRELHQLVFQGSLREVLRRPKLLQVVLDAMGGAEQAAVADVRDEAGVAELWWDLLALGTTAGRPARGEFLRGLASWTAEHLLEALPAGQLGAAGLSAYATVIEDLRGEEVLSPEEDAYGFAHDLFGDWSRYKGLGVWPGARAAISEQETRPLWHRAIRLFALRTLRGEGVERWLEQHNDLRESGHEIAADLYLDAPLFAADAEEHLEALWQALLDGDQALLVRMLTRFMLSGSVPDPRAALLTQGGNHHLQVAMAALWRLPTWVLWPPVLRALASRREEVVAAAPLAAAAMAELWLKVAPSAYPGREEAARLGFAAGQFAAEAHANHIRLDDDQRDKLWNAFLASGAELPDEVVSFVRAALDSDPTEDGWRRMDSDTLRKALMAPASLVPMMLRHPRAAADLVLVGLLREPSEPRFLGLEPDFGIATRITRQAPLPESGPLLALFTHAPDVAVPTLLKIVDHATAAWADTDMADVDDLDLGAAFELLVDREWHTLHGNSNVMHWHRGDSRVPRALASALMGLEQYLYRRLDGQLDTGPPLEDMLAELMQSRSVAIFGVLVEIACYRPELLRGVLAPLASSAALILADRLYKARGHGYLSMSVSDSERRRLQMWHGMEHRTKPLDQGIMPLAVSEGALVEELAAGRARWAQEPRDRWRFLIAQMDPGNYQRVDLEAGGHGWVFRMPDQLQQEIDADQPDLSRRQWWLTAPHLLSRWVEDATPVTAEEAQGLWDQVQAGLAETPPADVLEDGVLRRADVECGAAAALLVCARDWVMSQPEVLTFCREVLLRPFTEVPPTHMFDSPTELVDQTWDGFAAVALPILWDVAPEDPDIRQCIARLATHQHRGTVRRLFLTLQGYPYLLEDARRLEVLSLHWARCVSWLHERRHRQEAQEQPWQPAGPRVEDLPDLRPEIEGVFAAFADGSLDPTAPSLQTFIAATPAGMIPTEADPLYRIAHALDVSYLVAARVHLFSLPADLDDEERQRRLDIASQFASVFAGALVADSSGKVEGSPSEEEYDLYRRLGAISAQATLEEARAIWQPILRVGTPAYAWVSAFLSEVWSAALSLQAAPAHFARMIKEMLAFAAEQESWTGWHTDELQLDLLCLSRWGHPRMEERHRPLLMELQPEWAELVEPLMRSSYSARSIVPFLAKAVASDLIPTSLRWLSERERAGITPDDDVDQVTVELLAELIGRDATVVVRRPDAAEVLNALVARQNPVALQLSAQLGRNS